MTLGDAAARAGIAAAEALLQGLIGKWVAEGKDPHAEAQRIVSIEGGVTAVDEELQDLVDAKPSGKPNTGT